MLLTDKIAFVTGAAQGIGEAIAREFCREGATVVAADVDEPRLNKLTKSLNDAGHEAIPLRLDVTEREQVRDAIGRALERHGRIDVLVNNAGAYPRKNFLEMSDAEWDAVVDLNLNGVYNCSRAVAPAMVAQSSGSVVNVSSVTFYLGMANLTHYVAAKGGVVGFTRSLARDLGDKGVRVNCISPGAVETESEGRFVTPAEIANVILPQQCLKRRIVPRDIARVAVFLASPYADGITGQTINVDGGWVMH